MTRECCRATRHVVARKYKLGVQGWGREGGGRGAVWGEGCSGHGILGEQVRYGNRDLTTGWESGDRKVVLVGGSLGRMGAWIPCSHAVFSMEGSMRCMSTNPHPSGYALRITGCGAHVQNAEVKNGRLAMIGFSGMLHHALITHKGPIDQIMSADFVSTPYPPFRSPRTHFERGRRLKEYRGGLGAGTAAECLPAWGATVLASAGGDTSRAGRGRRMMSPVCVGWP